MLPMAERPLLALSREQEVCWEMGRVGAGASSARLSSTRAVSHRFSSLAAHQVVRINSVELTLGQSRFIA